MTEPRYFWVWKASNRKTGPMPVAYSERATCPPSCPHLKTSCYAHVNPNIRRIWDRIPRDGKTVETIGHHIASLPTNTIWRFGIAGDLPGDGESIDMDALRTIVEANKGRRGYAYTHKHTPEALAAIQWAASNGFAINLSADDAGQADELVNTGLPVACVVPFDTPELTKTPAGNVIRICPAQLREYVTCQTCGLCARTKRRTIVGFLPHGSRKKLADARARRVIPIVSSN